LWIKGSTLCTNDCSFLHQKHGVLAPSPHPFCSCARMPYACTYHPLRSSQKLVSVKRKPIRTTNKCTLVRLETRLPAFTPPTALGHPIVESTPRAQDGLALHANGVGHPCTDSPLHNSYFSPYVYHIEQGCPQRVSY
jgi:hypothetical protein